MAFLGLGLWMFWLMRMRREPAIIAAAALLAGWLYPAPAGPDPITFEDFAARAGVDFVLRNAATGDKRQIEAMVSGVAVFDYNNDGWPDLYFVNGAGQPTAAKGRSLLLQPSVSQQR